MQRFSGERGESPRHPRHAHRRIAVDMMNGCMVIKEPKGNPFCGVARNSIKYVVGKGHDVPTIG
jgi:hypothetical protein